MDTMMKNMKLVKLNTQIATFFFECTNFKDVLTEYKCLCCNKNYEQKFDEKLMERLLITYKLFNYDDNEFISLQRKGVYPYQYMDGWEKFKETSLPEKENFDIKYGRYY